MKKIILLLSLIASVFAAQSGSYMGFGAGYSHLKVDDTLNKNRESAGAIGSFTLGNRYGKYGRIYVMGMYKAGSNGYEDAGSISLAYDFLIPITEESFSLYAGFVGGYTGYNSNGLDLSGAHYGLEGGAIWNFAEDMELEVGLRALKESGSESLYTAERSYTGIVQVNFYFDSQKYFKYNN